MKFFRVSFAYIIIKILAIFKRFRALIVLMTTGAKFKAVGTNCKVRGEGMSIGINVMIGDFSWIETIGSYAGQCFSPKLIIGDEVALSDFVHISVIGRIQIGRGTLIGSKVYIGDHSHGHYRDIKIWQKEKNIIPKSRPLADLMDIKIGDNCWIGDGVVILAGSIIGNNCVVGANSVVKGIFQNDCIIAGMPAKIVKDLK